MAANFLAAGLVWRFVNELWNSTGEVFAWSLNWAKGRRSDSHCRNKLQARLSTLSRWQCSRLSIRPPVTTRIRVATHMRSASFFTKLISPSGDFEKKLAAAEIARNIERVLVLSHISARIFPPRNRRYAVPESIDFAL